MINSLLVDTGFWYALLNDQDQFHHRADQYLADCTQQLITTWPVITETCYLLLTRKSVGLATTFLEMAAQDYFVTFHLQKEHFSRAAVLMKKYADLPMDLADASLVILAEQLGHGRILSTDQRDFEAYRWKNHEPFENLLLPDSGITMKD
ncbi:MAG: PIN domain-containing protein [Thiolinea sp.]